MNVDFYEPSLFETNNARHKTPKEVALSFVPPADIFETLAARNNHILIGPRGSGKTTLLKMLTLPALSSWPQNTVFTLPKVSFIGIFIPADNGWNVQINGDSNNTAGIGTSAFTTHVLLAFAQSLLDIKRSKANSHVIQGLPTDLKLTQEADLAKMLAEAWQLKLMLQSLEGVKLALRQRLLLLKSLKKKAIIQKDPVKFLIEEAPFTTLNFKEAVSYGIDIFETVTGTSGLSWGLLFDEFEIAPTEIQEEVLTCLRGEQDGRLIFKVALAPYNENFIQQKNSNPTHDYDVIKLWYADKKGGLNFTEDLVKRLLSDEGFDNLSVRSMLGSSAFGEENDNASYGPDGVLTKAYERLAKIDPSFKEYYEKKNLSNQLKNWAEVSSQEKASIRKLRSIVITRENFLKHSDEKNSKPVQKRSRKRPDLYAGYPTILEICEGNPRTIINLFTPIVRQLKLLRYTSASAKVDLSFQADKIQYAANSFRALLKTIKYESTESTPTSLIKLLDKIAHYFQDQCLGEKFYPEPALSFTVPANADKRLLLALGRALNAGAIIYVPDAKADPIMGAMPGNRYRLNYLYATRFGLPIALNAEVSLSTILSKADSQNLTLFDEDQNE